jgi:hypothetical protein
LFAQTNALCSKSDIQQHERAKKSGDPWQSAGQTGLDRRQSTEFSDRFCSFANIRRATSPQSADFRRASPPLPNPIAQEVERHG